MAWKPSGPFITPLKLLIPTAGKVAGVNTKKYQRDGPVFFASFKTYGGTEVQSNNTIVVVDTATVECFFRPDITAGCRILNTVNNLEYEILGSPENIEMKNLYLRFKVKNTRGGA